MEGERQIRDTLYEILGEEGCGITCEDDADIFYDKEGWKLMLCGFMEPWKLGATVEEARFSLKNLGSMGYGLS
ncbi:MAG: hypothetical protein P4L55_06570 [Syntrophobacteraceae bacterium]|nr:hypothetical protein [Syntrophobacteraceae bacterium]